MQGPIAMYQENIGVKNHIRLMLDEMEKLGHANRVERHQFEVEADRIADEYHIGGPRPRNVAAAAISIAAEAVEERGLGIYTGRMLVGSVPYLAEVFGDTSESRGGEAISSKAVNEIRNNLLQETKKRYGGTKDIFYFVPERTKVYFKN